MNPTGSEIYFRIRLSTIKPDTAVPFNIYIRLNEKMTLYLKAGDHFAAEKIRLLHQRDKGESYFVEDKDKQLYRDYVKNRMNSNETNETEKAAVLRESSIAILEDLFDNPNIAIALDNSKPIITDLLNFMQNFPDTVGSLISLSGHDFYTYNHSFDTSIYSLGLGKALGYDQKTLEELGQASLFHDIGKRLVDLNILCKKGPLDEAEWAQMKLHPQFGLKLLNEHNNISTAVKAACYEHHESFNGGGYPQDISGEDIHPFARIVSLTDTFDAMTTQRSYNVPLRPSEALKLMKEKLHSKFDPEMLTAMHSVLFNIDTNKD